MSITYFYQTTFPGSQESSTQPNILTNTSTSSRRNSTEKTTININNLKQYQQNLNKYNTVNKNNMQL